MLIKPIGFLTFLLPSPSWFCKVPNVTGTREREFKASFRYRTNGRHDHVSSFAIFAVHFPHEDDTLAIVGEFWPQT